MRFRNHPSVILENSLKTIGTIIAIFFLNFISEIDGNGIQFSDVILLIVFLIFAMGLIIGVHAIIWSRTYIAVENNTLIVERNTLNKKRNTIGLKTISNVNLEQNLLEMLLGTCKVKLDTNSLSTADQTDVNIVLKKKDAEKFRSLVLAKSEAQKEDSPIRESGLQTEDAYDLKSDSKLTTIKGKLEDIILHGLFSIRISALICFIGLVVVEIGLLRSMGMDNIEDVFSEVLGSLFAGIWFAMVIGWGIVKEFIKYLNFKIERREDKVFLSYGFFKKIAYSVPIDKINGIRLTQTPIARLANRYMVEIINVGMDDDKNEANTFFLPYSKIEQIKEQLHILIPEFDGALEIKEERQPKEMWLLSIPWLIVYLAICVVTYFEIGRYTSDPFVKNGVWIVAAVLLICRIVYKAVGFFTKGINVSEKFLKIVDGNFARRILFVKYSKIQFVIGKQCVIAKRFGMQKGSISLLASMKNRNHALPYFKEKDMEQLKKYLL